MEFAAETREIDEEVLAPLHDDAEDIDLGALRAEKLTIRAPEDHGGASELEMVRQR